MRKYPPFIAGLLVLLLSLCLKASVTAGVVADETWMPLGPNAATIFAMARDPYDPNKILAGTYFGIPKPFIKEGPR